MKEFVLKPIPLEDIPKPTAPMLFKDQDGRYKVRYPCGETVVVPDSPLKKEKGDGR